MKYYLTFLSVLFSFFQLSAQRIELPDERIFLLSDKPVYKQGDTIQIHGQLLASGRQYDRYSNYIYAELFDEKDSVLIRQKTKLPFPFRRSMIGPALFIIYEPTPG